MRFQRTYISLDAMGSWCSSTSLTLFATNITLRDEKICLVSIWKHQIPFTLLQKILGMSYQRTLEGKTNVYEVCKTWILTDTMSVLVEHVKMLTQTPIFLRRELVRDRQSAHAIRAWWEGHSREVLDNTLEISGCVQRRVCVAFCAWSTRWPCPFRSQMLSQSFRVLIDW